MARKYFCTPGRRYTHGSLEFWAQGGMVHVWDNKDNSVHSISPSAAQLRAKKIAQCLPHVELAQDRIAFESVCNNLMKVAKEAFFQGDPTNQKVELEKIRHRSKSGKWCQVPMLYSQVANKHRLPTKNI